jgi:hypothetical protein
MIDTGVSTIGYLYNLPALPRCRNLETRQPRPIDAEDPRPPRLRWLFAFRLWLTLNCVWSGCTAVVVGTICYLLVSWYLSGVSKQEACPGLISPPGTASDPSLGELGHCDPRFPHLLVAQSLISETFYTISCRWRLVGNTQSGCVWRSENH